MIIEEITVTAFQQHTRIVGCEETRQAICIDPGDEAERIVETLERRGLKLTAIALTHAHLDHVGGVAAEKKPQPPQKDGAQKGRGVQSRGSGGAAGVDWYPTRAVGGAGVYFRGAAAG